MANIMQVMNTKCRFGPPHHRCLKCSMHAIDPNMGAVCIAKDVLLTSIMQYI